MVQDSQGPFRGFPHNGMHLAGWATRRADSVRGFAGKLLGFGEVTPLWRGGKQGHELLHRTVAFDAFDVCLVGFDAFPMFHKNKEVGRIEVVEEASSTAPLEVVEARDGGA